MYIERVRSNTVCFWKGHGTVPPMIEMNKQSYDSTMAVPSVNVTNIPHYDRTRAVPPMTMANIRYYDRTRLVLRDIA